MAQLRDAQGTAARCLEFACALRRADNNQQKALDDTKAADAAQVAQAEAGANAALIARKKRRMAGQGLLATGAGAAPATTVLGSAPGAGSVPTPRTRLGGL